ncbi:hypothetical protein K8I31_08105 [bacterium]|jgi:hypothetical protein|nr:hypothetical protein [bacterium]
MEPAPRTFASTEAATAHVKIDGVLRIVAIVCAFMFWYSVAIVLLLLHVSGVLPSSSLLPFAQVASAAGIAPIPVSLATWKILEWAFSKFLSAYAKKHFRS